MANKTEIAKRVVTFVIGACVSTTVKQVIESNTHPENLPEKAAVLTGSVVIGSMAADAAKDYTDRKIDELVNSWRELTAPND